jgi:hypothetical protein
MQHHLFTGRTGQTLAVVDVATLRVLTPMLSVTTAIAGRRTARDHFAVPTARRVRWTLAVSAEQLAVHDTCGHCTNKQKSISNCAAYERHIHVIKTSTTPLNTIVFCCDFFCAAIVLGARTHRRVLLRAMLL